MLVTVLHGVIVVGAVVFFAALFVLSFKSKVLVIKELAKTHRNPVPSRNSLNKLGKRAHTALCVSGVLAIASILVLAVIELFWQVK